MTPEQRNLCGALTILPNGSRRVSREEFVSRFPSALENGKLALRWLDEAYKARSADELDCALAIGFTFGFAPDHKDVLRRLVDDDWHYSHEDIVSVLQTWPTIDTVEALFHATQWIPKALEYDDSRALAVKAILALGKIPGTEAETKLEELARSDNAILRKTAQDQLERRHKTA
jgi:hypothetical protein